MRIRVATHCHWFPLPAIQCAGTREIFGDVWPWQITFWWGKRGIQIEGTAENRTA
jgi:hypothetical protein